MIIFLIVLFMLGCVQIWLWWRQQQRTRPLRQMIKNTRQTNSMVRWLGLHQAAPHVVTWLNQLSLYLLGKHYSLLIQNIIVLLLVQGGGLYVNQAYLQFNTYLLQLLLFMVTLIGLYYYRKKRMRRAFEVEFTEALNIVNSAIRSGHTVTDGIKQCAEKLGDMMGDEFRQVMQRLDIGEEPHRVFWASYQRLPYREYYFFINAVLINIQGGGQLREVMARLGQMVTNGRKIERQKMAKTSEIRMSVKILAAIPIGFLFFMRYMTPDNFNLLLHDPTGRLMLYYFVGSEVLGLLVLRIMMNRI